MRRLEGRVEKGKFVKGCTSLYKGKKSSEETRRKLRGRWASRSPEERARLISYLRRDGCVPWNKGKKFNDETRRRMSVAQKKKENKAGQFKKGVQHPLEVQQKAIRNSAKTRVRPTSAEKIFINLCQEHHLPYKYTGDGTFLISRINPDFIDSNGKKRAVEIFGRYWHSPILNPNLVFGETVEGRKNKLKQYGWDSIIIWEDDLINNPTRIIEQLKTMH